MFDFIPADSETLPIAPAYGSPDLVCVQFDEGKGPRLVTRRAGALDEIARLLEGPRTLVLHSAAYDLTVWTREGLAELVFDKLDRGQVHCTWVYERLGEISGYSERKSLDLGTCLRAHGLPAPTLKDSGLAVDFGRFIDAHDIPEPHRQYALDDLQVGRLYERQRRRFRDVPIRALERLTYRQFALQLMSVWGMRVDVGAAEALYNEASVDLEALRKLAIEWGFIRDVKGKPTLSIANVQAAVLEAYGKSCPRTATGQPGRSEMVLNEASDPRLQAFSAYNGLIKTITNDVPNLLAVGGSWISTRYGMADTTRTTSGSGRKKKSEAPNGLIAMQNLRQKGGVRECIRPRPGYAFYDADASGLELCTFAQNCKTFLGRTDVADMINAAGSPGAIHTAVAAAMTRASVDDVKRALAAKDPHMIQVRTRAKNGVFGYMGGLGVAKFVDYVKMLSKGKTVITQADAEATKRAVHAALPALPAYLKWVGEGETAGGTFDCLIPGYNVVRKGVWYCAAANNPFQGLAAAVLTEVLIDLARECYVGSFSAVRPCLFVHDEALCEVPMQDVADFDAEFGKLATAAARRVMPDVITVWEAEATDRYSKQAKRVVDKHGRLCVWTP